MSTTELKSGISKMLKKVKNEHLLKVVYSLVRDYAEYPDSLLTGEQKKEIARRMELHLKGKSRNYSIDDVRKEFLSSVKK